MFLQKVWLFQIKTIDNNSVWLSSGFIFFSLRHRSIFPMETSFLVRLAFLAEHYKTAKLTGLGLLKWLLKFDPFGFGAALWLTGLLRVEFDLLTFDLDPEGLILLLWVNLIGLDYLGSLTLAWLLVCFTEIA